MTSHRQDRVSIEIQRILSDIIINEMKDPRLKNGNVTVSRVEVTNDMSYAKIYFSILGKEEEREERLLTLEKAKGFFRSQLAQHLDVRHVPELDFKLDTSIEEGIRMSVLLDKLKETEHQNEAEK